MLEEAEFAVLQFHEKFGAKIGSATNPQINEGELRAALIEEEAKETCDAIRTGDLIGALDGLADLVYVAIGAAVAFGVNLGPIFRAVHETNMKKEGGTTREDGKILKPANWTPPDIPKLLEEQKVAVNEEIQLLMLEEMFKVIFKV